MISLPFYLLLVVSLLSLVKGAMCLYAESVVCTETNGAVQLRREAVLQAADTSSSAPLPGALFYVYSEHLGYSCALSYSSRVLTFVYIQRGGRLQYLTMVKYCMWFCSHGDENNTVVLQ